METQIDRAVTKLKGYAEELARELNSNTPAEGEATEYTEGRDETINLKWYAIPPYNREGWRIFNEKGELVAVFEDRAECEHAVHLHNLTLDRIKPR